VLCLGRWFCITSKITHQNRCIIRSFLYVLGWYLKCVVIILCKDSRRTVISGFVYAVTLQISTSRLIIWWLKCERPLLFNGSGNSSHRNVNLKTPKTVLWGKFYVIPTAHVLTSIYGTKCALYDTSFMTYQLLRVSAPRCCPERVIVTDVCKPTRRSRFWSSLEERLKS
jgi:hypothetical protein